ncbi:hypothetical protein [Levilactobacillus spicheri]|uniref:Uncharacterized protein n=1 Tax=Levilactobacillus spicheri TaxID=216463 RepID=A0A0F3RUM2_9LACO|nr:hypothetical protein [Levilactobacillus spicheri]KJW12853.1 hypothetical protein VC81_06280 [Levilactobacillus spicheri]KJW13600.1 hypothetical protein VC81_03830 [Levilactobacillus spicheri]
MDKNEFVKLFGDKISEVANQDAVRGTTLNREIKDGTMDLLVNNAVTVATYTYKQALKSGFNDDKAFYMACQMAGIEIEAPYNREA